MKYTPNFYFRRILGVDMYVDTLIKNRVAAAIAEDDYERWNHFRKAMGFL